MAEECQRRGAVVRLGEPVVKVLQSAGSAVVVLKSGRRISARAVVVAVPLPRLKTIVLIFRFV